LEGEVSADFDAAELSTFTDQFRHWLDANLSEVSSLLAATVNFDERVAAARKLREILFESGWGRWGWPARVGGLGGSILHRAAIYEVLSAAGWHGPTIFEHLEIIGPTLVRYADSAYAAKVMPRFLDGTRAWAQAFSEPEAGSDLASLRTRAVRDGDEYIVTGRKLWTSWAKWSNNCIALVRTGTPEERHRGLTMLALDLDQPGVDIRPIKQANGTDELAEVSFDEVRVPAAQLIGQPGEGWQVAMYLLAHERGTLSWFRHCHFRYRLAEAGGRSTEPQDVVLGQLAVELAGLRAASMALIRADAVGATLGAASAYNKLLMTRFEQRLYDALRDLYGADITAPTDDAEAALLQQEYLFSRIVTVYGGSQEMQLTTIASHILGLRA
jgi:alkylation response protein AidB-like acyl-CoA dehydrogenase